MKFATTIAAGAALVAGVSAQAQNQSLCDKYTTALLKNNTGENQLTVLTLVVNTALIGNYTSNPGSLNKVDGILTNEGKIGGKTVNLLKYFDGSLKSTNENGEATAVNWLDGGGAEPLKQNKPGNDGSRQATLVTHLYQYFGALLGCTAAGFPAYAGETSQSSVHRFMNLSPDENNYFISQVGAAATSFGVSAEDATAVGNTLNTTFNVRCAPPAAIPPTAEPASQSCCLSSECQTPPGGGQCEASGNSYPNGTNGVAPALAATSSSMGGSGSASGSASAGASGSASGSAGGAAATTSARPDGASVNAVNAFGALALAAAGLVAVGL